MNLVMTGSGTYIEVQGSAERAAFNRNQLDEMLNMGEEGIRQIFEAQKAALEGA
jgi:ribonuclease PH